MNKNSLLNQNYICPIGADGIQGLPSLFLKRDTCGGSVHAYLPQLTRHHAEAVSVHNRGFFHVMAKR